MFILGHVIGAVVLVFLGYIALWTASQNTIPKEVAKFGKVMSIILYVFAGLVIVFSLTCMNPCCGGMKGPMGWHGCCMKGGMEKPCMGGKEGMKDMKCMKGMKGMQMAPEETQEQKENAAPEQK